jgi:hypothetical protein
MTHNDHIRVRGTHEYVCAIRRPTDQRPTSSHFFLAVDVTRTELLGSKHQTHFSIMPSSEASTQRVATQVAVAAAGAAMAYYVGSRSKSARRAAVTRRAKAVAEAKAASLPTDLERRKLTSVVVRVPATTANMGPGFDTIGMALDIWTEISAEVVAPLEGDAPTVRRMTLTNEGEGAKELPTDEGNLVIVGIKAAFKAAGEDLPRHIKVHCKNRIPFARGLGSSSAGIVGGIIAGLALAGMRLPVHGREELLQLVRDLLVRGYGRAAN